MCFSLKHSFAMHNSAKPCSFLQCALPMLMCAIDPQQGLQIFYVNWEGSLKPTIFLAVLAWLLHSWATKLCAWFSFLVVHTDLQELRCWKNIQQEFKLIFVSVIIFVAFEKDPYCKKGRVIMISLVLWCTLLSRWRGFLWTGRCCERLWSWWASKKVSHCFRQGKQILGG